MKTPKKNLMLIVSLTVLISLHLNATIIFFSGNNNDNISYTTEMVVDNTENSELISTDFSFEEESYIDDIPFDTECISAQCKYEKAMSVEFSFEDEEYIDDIDL